MTNFYTETPRAYKGNLERYVDDQSDFIYIYNEFLAQKNRNDDPINNMGVTRKNKLANIIEKLQFEAVALRETVAIDAADDQIKVITTRKGSNGHVAFIDWINFHVHVSTFGEGYEYSSEWSDAHYLKVCQSLAECASKFLTRLFGNDFKISKQRQTGLNFYDYSFEIGRGLGKLCIGGKNKNNIDTMLFMLSGTACTIARHGWENTLYDYLTEFAKRPKITRIDLAHDDIQGDYLDIDFLDELESQDGFYLKGTRPKVDHIGNWKYKENDKLGRTLTIGSRSNGKFARFYEKGKKEGDPSSKWVRAEVELKSKARILPLDMLIKPSDYFMGCYPCFDQLFQYQTSQRLTTVKKTSEISLDKSFDIWKTQMGKYVNYYRNFYTDQQILDSISGVNDDIPKRLRIHSSLVNHNEHTLALYEKADSMKFDLHPIDFRETRKQYQALYPQSEPSYLMLLDFYHKKNPCKKLKAIEQAHESLIRDLKLKLNLPME